MPDPSPPRLKLPSRLVRNAEEEIPTQETPGIKLPTRPRERAGASGQDADPMGNRGEVSNRESRRQVAPAGFQFQNDRVRRRARRAQNLGWMQAGIALGTLVVGYALGHRHGPPVPPPVREKPPAMTAPTAAEQADLDAAFAAMKSARYAEARRLFAALAHTHPQWPTLNHEIALATLSEADVLGFKTFVERGEISGEIAPADSRTLLGQLSISTGQYDDADRFLGEAANADPIRADTYYYWGDCLLRRGKPAEAIEKFRAAQLRNPYPTAETLCEAKLWLAEVASGRETTDGTAARIDKALAADRPSSQARFAEAARAVKAGRFAEAAEALAKARDVSDPPMFRVMLLDSYFNAERWRHEFAPVYRETFNLPMAPATDDKIGQSPAPREH